MAKINSKIDKALRKEVIENGVFLGTIFVLGFTVNAYVYENEVYCEVFQLTENDYVVTDFYQSTWGNIHNNIGHGRFDNNEPYAEALIDFMSLLKDSLYLSNKKYREIAKEQFAELKKDYQESGLLDDINALLKKSKSKTFRYSKYESEKNTRKSLKEDSLDDIIPMGHSEYFDTLVEFFKDNDVPIRISHTASGGKICYVENDMDFISVIFKSPKHGYELLRMIELWNDGSVYLSRKMGSAWFFKHVPLNEVYVWDMDKDEFVNYKGKVLKNIDYDDIVESKKNVRKSIKESMNLDYSDFDYKKFENWIIRYLEDYGCEVNTVEIICDDYGYDVEINVENAENLPNRISDKDYGAFIFDAMYTTNCLYLKMPIVRAMKIAEEFSPKVLKVNDDSILIGDKNSDTEIWLDVWTDNDGDEDYTEWDYNQQSFNLNNYEDMVQKYLQQIDDFFYILDEEVSDNF